jgi:predicted SnoaL-like aldol condensation-catalyzing enzyme
MADSLDTSERARLTDREVADRFIEVFYKRNRLVDAFRAWVHPDYIQHDPQSGTGRDATIEALDAHMKRSPGMSHDVKRVIHGKAGPDGTLVVVHYHFRHAPDQRGAAVADIFRIKDGYLVEHWDIIQPLPDPAEAKNPNGMF